jgi:hypothetical protein
LGRLPCHDPRRRQRNVAVAGIRRRIRVEQEGWKLAEVLTPIAYVAWSLWLILVGVALLL